MTGRRCRLSLPLSRAGIDRLLPSFARFASDNAIPDAARRDIHLVLDEMVSNIVFHGRPLRPGSRIIVDLAVDETNVRAEISDATAPFDPLSQAPVVETEAELADRPIGGLGIHLVRKLMDRVDYRWEKGRNRLIIERRLHRPPGPAQTP